MQKRDWSSYFVALFAFMASATSAGHATAATYVIDREYTEVRVSWDHLGVSRQAGRFLDVIGRVEFDPARAEESSVDVTIKVASFSSGIEKLDKLLTSTADFFDLTVHPDITFRSTSVVMTTAKTGNVTGELTINGITKPVTLSVVWNYSGEHPLAKVNPVYQGVEVSGFSARGQILRSEWGIVRSLPLISDELRISIETEMHRVP